MHIIHVHFVENYYGGTKHSNQDLWCEKNMGIDLWILACIVGPDYYAPP